MSIDIADSFVGIPTGNICDSNNREGSMDPSIKPLHHKFHFVGYAMTLNCIPGDNLTIHKAIEESKPGAVLIINCKGYTGAGVFGELFAISCIAHGIRGVVIDGACRDRNKLIEMGFPVFAKEVNPNGTLKEVCGEIDTIIECGGRIVKPEDIIIGDGDGVVVIPREKAEAVLKRAEEIKAFEDKIKPDLVQGKATTEIFGLKK